MTTEFPTTVQLEKAKPVIEKLPGWKCDIRGIKKYEDLRRTAGICRVRRKTYWIPDHNDL